MRTDNTIIENYEARIEALESRLEEAEGLIEAIKTGEVDAFAFINNDKHEVFTLQSGDFAYRVMVENIHEGAVNLSQDGLIVYSNKSFYGLLGMPYEKVIGNQVIDFIDPASCQKFRQLFAEALASGSTSGEINLLAGEKIIPVNISFTSLQPTLPTVGIIVTDLTEKRQAEKNAAVTSTLQNIFRQSPAAIAVMEGPEFIFVSANNLYLKLVNRTDEELLGKPLATAFPETVAQGIIELYEKVFLSGEPVEVVEKEVALNKQVENGLVTGFFSWVMQPIKDEAGNVVSIMTHVVDVTEQVLARKKLHDSGVQNAMLAAIVQSSEDAIVSKTLQGIITTWNAGAEKLFGYKPEEIIGQHVSKLIPADRHGEEPQIIGKISNGEVMTHFETKRITKEGALLDISLTISPIKDGNGNIIGASKIARDITGQKLAEERLKQSENELNELANAVPQLVWMADAGGNVQYYNDRIFEFTPASQDENGHWNWDRLLHYDDVEPTSKAWKYALQNKSVYEKEHRLKLKDGSYKWFLSRGYPQKSKDGTVVKWYGTATDIHAQKLHESQKDEFLKMVSHELKTPVTSIKGYVQLMLAMLETNDSPVAGLMKQPLKRIDNQVERLGKLITGILDISRLEDGRMDMQKENFRLDELIKETVQDVLFATTTHNVVINHSFPCTVYADKNRIGQALINLINNAIKYSPDKDKVEISLYSPNESFVSVAIKDYGVGIDKGEHTKIFDRFYQTGNHQNQNYTGFGIGLYITAEIIHRHGGEITLSSEKNKGSLFTFTIPLTNKTILP